MNWDQETNGDAVEVDPPAPLPFERRMHDRWPVNVTGSAVDLGGESFGRMHQIKVIDFSDGGLGAISESPLTPGSVISIGFSAPGMYARRGTVLRCSPCGEGYRVSIQFEARLAA